MGRRSINTTKSGKYMNPTDQARKEARKRELKKNKKQRMMVRQAVLKGKDPVKLLEDMEVIDKMEYNPMEPPSLNEKVLKDKRKKLIETFERVTRLYEKEDPEYFMELKRAEMDYEKKKNNLIVYYEQVKYAEQVQLDEIPTPDMPQPTAAPLPPAPEIPAPPITEKKPGILKKEKPHLKRKPPGPPPGPPPELSDDEHDDRGHEPYDPTEGLDLDIMEPLPPGTGEDLSSTTDEPPAKTRKIRFKEDTKTIDEDTRLKFLPPPRPAPTRLQMRLLKLAGQKMPEKEAQELLAAAAAAGSDEDDDEDDESEKPKEKEEIKKTKDGAPGAPPGPPPLMAPMMFRPPPMRPNPRMMPPGPPPGRPPGLPPGPPPGLPPGLPPSIRPPPRLPPPRPPSGLPPPRLLRPPGSTPVTLPSGPTNVLSAPPSIKRPAQLAEEEKKKTGATIEAKPQLKNLIGDATKFLPTSLRVKREARDTTRPKAKIPKKDDMPNYMGKSTREPNQTKDDVYDSFMSEMQDLL